MEKEFEAWWDADGEYAVKAMEIEDDSTAPSREDAKLIAKSAWEKAWELSRLTTLLEAAKSKPKFGGVCGPN